MGLAFVSTLKTSPEDKMLLILFLHQMFTQVKRPHDETPPSTKKENTQNEGAVTQIFHNPPERKARALRTHAFLRYNLKYLLEMADSTDKSMSF